MADDRARPHALDIYERVVEDTVEELGRANRSLVFSGLFAGFAIGLAPLAFALATVALGADARATMLIASLLYPIGYVAVIVGRAQFFAENTLYPVMVTLRRPRYLRRTAEVWAIVLATNLIGALLFAALAVLTGALAEPVQAELVGNGVAYTGGDTLDNFWSGVVTGFLLALVAWLVEASDGTIARIGVIWALTFVVALGTFDHSIATSINAFSALIDGALGIGEVLGWLAPVTLGNIAGGVLIVAAINYGQVEAEN